MRVGCIALLPQRVAENDFLLLAGLLLFRKESAAELGMHAEQTEEICGDLKCLNLLRLAVAGKIYFTPRVDSEFIK